MSWSLIVSGSDIALVECYEDLSGLFYIEEFQVVAVYTQARVEFCHCRDSILAFTLEDDIYIDI